MKKIIIRLSFIAAFYSCGDTGQMETDDHAHGINDSHAQVEGVIELSLEQMKNIGLQFGKMEERAIRSLVKLNGRVELPPSGMAVASSPIGGRIVDVLIEPGQAVIKGQKLFSVFSLELVDWQREYLQMRADLEFLEKELERQKQLSEEKIAPEKQYQETHAKFQSKHLGLKAVTQKLAALGISTKSNFEELLDHFYVYAGQSGRVEHININSGAFVEPSLTLVEIINDKNLHLHLLAYGKQSDLIEVGQNLHFNVLSRPGEIQNARIKWINNVVNEENNSYDIHAEVIDERRDLIAGEFVEARVMSDSDSLWSVPTNAVTFDRGLEYLFVLSGADSDGTHFRKVQIQSGIEDLGYVEVLPVDPLTESDQIVTEGAFFLMAETKKQEMGEAGHSH